MTPEKFHALCEAQIERLGGAFPEFRFTKPGAVQELVAWLEDRAKGDEKQTIGFITSVTELSVMPTIADLNKIWHRLYGIAGLEKHVASRDCQACNGTGWEEIEGVVKSGPFAGQPRTGVTRCRCGGMPPTQSPDQAQSDRNRKEQTK